MSPGNANKQTCVPLQPYPLVDPPTLLSISPPPHTHTAALRAVSSLTQGALSAGPSALALASGALHGGAAPGVKDPQRRVWVGNLPPGTASLELLAFLNEGLLRRNPGIAGLAVSNAVVGGGRWKDLGTGPVPRYPPFFLLTHRLQSFSPSLPPSLHPTPPDHEQRGVHLCGRADAGPRLTVYRLL